MMRPSSLYRSDSRRQPNLEANANNINEDSIDCGITALRCCNSPKCQKMANKRTFMIVLIACGLIQGAIEMYFVISAKQAALTHDTWNTMVVDWLLVASGIFQGIFAIFIGYWGNKFHRTAWFGALFMLQAFVCILVVIPTLVHHSEENNTLDAIELSMLCIRHRSENLMSNQMHSSTTLAMLFALQLFIGLSVIAFYTLGLSYLDDNVYEHESPGLIGAALAARFWGTQIGSLVSLLIGWSTYDWFLGWIILAPILFITGFLIVMFPKKLLSTVVQQAADNILETSSHASLANRKFIADVGFCSSLCRIFTNKIVLINIFAAVFVQTGIVNFFRYESQYLQSRFYLPASETDGLSNEWTSLLVSNLLKPPMLALSILVSGLIIAKGNPSAKKIVTWNVFACSVVVLFFILSIFIDCEKSPIAGAYRGKIVKPMCASECLCSDNTPFMPVCPENGVQTFYSPCYAGCGAEITINDILMFGNCSCGIDIEFPLVDVIATSGACGMSNCRPFYIAFHGLIIMAAALIASTLVGKLIIGIRAVLPQDKSLAIAAEVMFVGIFVFIPGKIGYAFIAERTCQYEAPDGFRCFLHESPLFGDWMNVVTALLISIGVFFEVILMFCVKDLELYGDEEETESYRPIEMNTYSRNGDSYNPPEIIQQQPDPDVPPTAALLQNYLQSIPPPEATYAQIQRPINASNEGLDFRLQTPRTDENSSIGSDYRSVTSNNGCTNHTSPYSPITPNGYVNFVPYNRHPSNRPQSPETDF